MVTTRETVTVQRGVDHDIETLLQLFVRRKDVRNWHYMVFMSRTGVPLRVKVTRTVQNQDVVFSLTSLTPLCEELKATCAIRGDKSREATTLTNFVLSVQTIVQDIERCTYCRHLFCNVGRQWSSCSSCMALLASRLRAPPCIICLTSCNPITFLCDDCVDSQICSLCWENCPKLCCQVCKRASKRLRFDYDDGKENDEGNDEEDEDADEIED